MTAPSLIEEIAALGREWGREDLAEAVERARAVGADPVATVVVVGEIKRGKSRFVNALVGARVCPVDADIASNVFVTVGFGPSPAARVVTETQPEGLPVALAEVPEWSSEQGNPRNSRAVERVDATVPAPLLAEGLRVIDTPGVGGLQAAHRQVSLATLRWADALVFVLDLDAPLSRPEYEFLIEAADRIGSVFFVLTKSDLYLDWEEIAAENLRLIGTHAPRFRGAPVFAVSSLDKEEADLEGDAELLEQSGFPAVEAALRERVVGRAVKLRLWNLARSALAAVDELEAPERITLDAEGRPHDAVAALEAARAASRAHDNLTRSWTAPLFVEHQRRVANPVQLGFRRRIRELSDIYERRIAEGTVELDALPAELDAELRALALDLRDEIVRATDDLLEYLADLYGLELPTKPAAGLAPAELPLELPSLADAPDLPSNADPAQRMVAAGSLARNALYGRSLAAAMGPLGLVVGVAIGAAGMAGGQLAQRRARDKQAARALVARAMETARLEIDADLRSRLLDAQQLVQKEIRLLVEQRARALKEELARREQAAAQSADERRAAGAAARARLGQTAPLRASAESMCLKAEGLLASTRHTPTYERTSR